MLRCAKCSYAWNPDTATTCVQCKSPLTVAAVGEVSPSIRTPEAVRRQTIAEGVATGGFGSGLGAGSGPGSGLSATPPPPFPGAKAPAAAPIAPIAPVIAVGEPVLPKPAVASAPVMPREGLHEADLYKADQHKFDKSDTPGSSGPVAPDFKEPGLGQAGSTGGGGSPSRMETLESRWSDSTAAERAERKRTVFAGASTSAEVRTGSAPAPVSDLRLNSPSAPFNSGQRRPQTLSVDPNRKIVGVLITYTWVDTGQIFPILEGRNLIGNDPDQCDICIPEDATLSAVNSFITFRRNFIIGDKVSMSGTDVDGEPVESQFILLKNYARIRTGSTHWTFVAMQPPSLQPAEFTTGEKFTTGEM